MITHLADYECPADGWLLVKDDRLDYLYCLKCGKSYELTA